MKLNVGEAVADVKVVKEATFEHHCELCDNNFETPNSSRSKFSSFVQGL